MEKNYVFPEYGLTGKTTDTSYSIELPTNFQDKNNYTEILRKLGSMANEHNVYLVTNILEQFNKQYYNTVVVFDRTGRIIEKYQKINLGPDEKNLTGGSNLSSFTTDFDVTFGLITNEDLFFKNPSQDILMNGKIKDVIVPMSWNNFLPFDMATTIQSGYAISNNITVLAANTNNPASGISGGGFYGANQEVFITGANVTKPVYFETDNSNVKKGIKESSMATLKLENNIAVYKEFDDYQMDTATLIPELNRATLKMNGARCTTHIDYNDEASDRDIFFKSSVINSKKTIGQETVPVIICAIYLCEKDDIETCGKWVESYPNIQIRKITVKFTVEEASVILRPLTLDGNLVPLENYAFSNRSNIWTMQGVNMTQNVLVFGIEAIGEVKESSAVKIIDFSSYLILAILIIFNYIL
ncbi:vanin-like protein 3 isoform X2 [Aethina tumida]|uniref:vanin-like protein 3 isoform X2 n=1 Tax=Aethina tumida TaxID=116153 RepID=UPI0021499025|nr:vanin-like protein 3 isoform X2 [Aethina tumida]